jgi:uncharacterized protein YcbX
MRVGRVCELSRYPVKSMAGFSLESAELGWHGVDGDRRFAFHRLGDSGNFPWLTASRLPDLVLYHPVDSGDGPVSTVRTPDGRAVELRGTDLQAEIAARFGSAVELMEMKNGVFDDGSVSIIALPTIDAIGREAGLELDRRRMRANIVLETDETQPFLEDAWVGATLVFGDDESSPAVTITSRDERCVMVNIDPDTGDKDARVMKAVVRLNGNHAGVYGTIVRRGTISVGQTVNLVRA